MAEVTLVTTFKTCQVLTIGYILSLTYHLDVTIVTFLRRLETKGG